MRWGWAGVLLALGLASAMPGCDSAPTGRCRSDDDCASGRACVDGRCAIDGPRDAAGLDAAGLDAAGLDVGGDLDGGDLDGSSTEDVPFVATAPDEDGDFVSDAQENRTTNVDSDGDGVPDWRDLDSDGDGIFDADEAGDRNYLTPPVDTDADGIPDFRDLDSDGNGIFDASERGDADADGRLDAAEVDNDGDGLLDVEEIGPSPTSPRDTDGDGTPDMNEIDSDADTITDAHEDLFDTDADGARDGIDLDSDDDGWLDAEEAGDAVLTTLPVDSDGDGVRDYRDPDSDNDGLSDTAERGYGTDRTRADSDGDGVSDLIEIGAGTSPTDGTVSPRTRGDFVFVVPYMMPPDPERDTLSFRTSIQFADIYFLFDSSTSMDGEIGALRTAVTTIIADLICTDYGTPCTRDDACGAGQVCGVGGTCIEDPTLDSCVASPWTGAGSYESSYRNRLSLQPSPAATSTALSFGTSGGTENLYTALTQLASGGGTGCATPLPADRIGCPAFRRDAVRLAVVFTDEDSDGGALATAATALQTAGITLIGVWSAPSTTGRSALVNVVRDSGSLSSTGAPLIFDGEDGAVTPLVVNAINEVVENVPLRATIEATDEPGDAGDALQFIERLETNTTSAGCAAVMTEDTNGDGFPDAFPAVRPGTGVCWDVIPRMNTTVMPALTPLIYRARLTVRGDGSPLDSRIVYFLVPPRIPEPGS